MAEAKKRRKPKGMRKDTAILIRVTESQKRLIVETAEAEGLGASSWMLAVALREANARR